MDRLEQRRASRIVLLDASGRVLLFRHAPPTGETFWAMPGGGLEDDETFEEAARREAREELGLESGQLRFLWENTSEFVYIDRMVRQREQFFRIEHPGDIVIGNLSAEIMQVHVRESILQVRWWTIEEIESTRDSVFPEELASRLRQMLS